MPRLYICECSGVLRNIYLACRRQAPDPQRCYSFWRGSTGHRCPETQSCWPCWRSSSRSILACSALGWAGCWAASSRAWAQTQPLLLHDQLNLQAVQHSADDACAAVVLHCYTLHIPSEVCRLVVDCIKTSDQPVWDQFLMLLSGSLTEAGHHAAVLNLIQEALGGARCSMVSTAFRPEHLPEGQGSSSPECIQQACPWGLPTLHEHRLRRHRRRCHRDITGQAPGVGAGWPPHHIWAFLRSQQGYVFQTILSQSNNIF